MIEQRATVVGLDPGIVWVETARRSACGGCALGDGPGARSCPSPLLARLFRPETHRFAADDPWGSAIGDQVVVGIPDRLLLRAALAAYGLPLVALVAAAALAQSLQVPDVLVATAGITGLCGSLWLTSRLTGGREAHRRYRPLVVRRGPRTQAIPFGIHPPAPGALEESTPR